MLFPALSRALTLVAVMTLLLAEWCIAAPLVGGTTAISAVAPSSVLAAPLYDLSPDISNFYRTVITRRGDHGKTTAPTTRPGCRGVASTVSAPALARREPSSVISLIVNGVKWLASNEVVQGLILQYGEQAMKAMFRRVEESINSEAAQRNEAWEETNRDMDAEDVANYVYHHPHLVPYMYANHVALLLNAGQYMHSELVEDILFVFPDIGLLVSKNMPKDRQDHVGAYLARRADELAALPEPDPNDLSANVWRWNFEWGIRDGVETRNDDEEHLFRCLRRAKMRGLEVEPLEGEAGLRVGGRGLARCQKGAEGVVFGGRHLDGDWYEFLHPTRQFLKLFFQLATSGAGSKDDPDRGKENDWMFEKADLREMFDP